ncbi:hypothetical protein [Alterisphingorhabdus coralli]|uniref:Peptidase S11 D-alanyl-D-alanine carboxypeptidase A N-terminal domain-containing protein n=1 Tax=Alterisphingorhabdus coralli TaxID=3071408 RepID=A0AA97F8I6_9SPHN|nr:hypothetical protein [Parasphingorhabdus sp. SCSIO 66989]WOE76329.1 hypothetical protein RB602_06350 [Parasphingorhabdus sp. SCSIO 66989]
MGHIGRSGVIVPGLIAASATTIAPPTRLLPGLNSRFMAAYNSNRDHLLYNNRADESWDFPASVIKMVTVLLIEELKAGVIDSETITWLTQDEEDEGPFNSSDLPFQSGDVVTWRNALKAIILDSAGDGTRMVGRIIGNEALGQPIESTLGLPHFVTLMNQRCRSIPGYGRSVFTETQGTAKYGPLTDNNPNMTARDLALIGAEVFRNPIARAIGSIASDSVVIAGPNARTISTSNPHAGVGISGFAGGKNGGFNFNGNPPEGPTTRSQIMLWLAPNGDQISIATMDCASSAERSADVTAILNALPSDFPYLAA